MDNPEKMDELNQGGSSSSVPVKRKRGGSRSDDEGQTQQQLNPPVTTTSSNENLIGRIVSGVVEGSFEAGYFLRVKVADTDKQLKGIVFLPNKVTPVTPTTDLFPQAKMYSRAPTTEFKSQADDIGSQPQTDKIQSTTLPDSHPMSAPVDTEMGDVGGSSAGDKLTEPEGQTLSLMPQFDKPKDYHTVLRTEACAASKTPVAVNTTSSKDSNAGGSTNSFVDFFPAPATNPKQATGSNSALSLELFQNEAQRSGSEDEKSTKDGMDEKPVSPVDDELQLELGNKKMSASAIATETDPDHPASSKGGFLANLFESREEEKVKEPEESNVGGSESRLPEATTQADVNDC